jgi:nitroreductase
MDALNAIFTRRSVRAFRPDSVDPDSVRTILEGAMHAASAGDQQPWRFVVIQDRATLEAIAHEHPYASVVAHAPLAILVCGATRDLAHPDFWADDCAAATQNLMLAAHALGLGSVWVGLHPRADRMEILRRAAHLPEDVEPFALVPIGHPAERPGNPERYRAEWIRAERWHEAWAHGRD